jgi:hypothetical protein
MKNLFRNIVLPLAIFAVAIFGALQTSAMNQKSKMVVPQKGYITLNEEEPCAIEVDCDRDDGPICQYLSIRAWGKFSPTDMHCPVPLSRVPQ